MLERLDDAVADCAEDLREGCIARESYAHGQRVHEEAHDLLELGELAAAHRNPDDEVGLPGQLVTA